MLFSRKISAVLFFLCLTLTSVTRTDIWSDYKAQLLNPKALCVRFLVMGVQTKCINWVTGSSSGNSFILNALGTSMASIGMRGAAMITEIKKEELGVKLWQQRVREIDAMIVRYAVDTTLLVAFLMPYQKAYAYVKKTFSKPQVSRSAQEKSAA